MEDVARVVLAMEQHDVAEEVMHFLDRSGRARVVATAADDRQLSEAIRQLEPDAVIGQPSLVRDGVTGSKTFIALETRESVGALRAAIHAGASGFFVWPVDRDALSSAAAETHAGPLALDRRALVVAVHAARGGAGATFMATHLARAFARRGRSCCLIDGDPAFGDVGAALGAPDNVRSLGDLLPLGAELTVAHLNDALWTHADGFRVLVAAPPGDAPDTGATDVRRVIDVAASSNDVVVIHLSRGLDPITRSCLEAADRIAEVVTLDVLGFRAAKQTCELLRPAGMDGSVRFVVNRATRAEITPRDVERVFGSQPVAVIALDRGVARAQDHGRLVSARGRTGRAIDRLAARLEEAFFEAGTPT
jgi:Flp pilus assembly CpaE family ATPase